MALEKPFQHSELKCAALSSSRLHGYAVTFLLVLIESDFVGREIQDVDTWAGVLEGEVFS